jgi:hypothetical protein
MGLSNHSNPAWRPRALGATAHRPFISLRKPKDYIFGRWYSLYGNQLQQAIVFPGPLDEARFTASFAYALSRFPHAAGRLRCVNGKWFIALTNSPCPIIYGTSTVELTDKMLEAPHPYATQPIDMGYQAAPTEEPMVKAVVTNWPKTGETTFGLSFAHVLGTLRSASQQTSASRRAITDCCIS